MQARPDELLRPPLPFGIALIMAHRSTAGSWIVLPAFLKALIRRIGALFTPAPVH